MKIIKQELEFEECPKQRLEFICEFSKVTPTFINGSIRKLEKTNHTYLYYFSMMNNLQSWTPNKNRHFTRKERNSIEKNVKLGLSKRKIARRLGRHLSSVCDEVNRNSDKKGLYRGFPADMQYLRRRIKRQCNL